MANFNSLPNEMLSGIVSYIKDKKTLASLCVVSHRVRAATERWLYKDIQLLGDRYLPIFVCSVATRPALGGHVRVLRLEWDDEYEEFEEDAVWGLRWWSSSKEQNFELLNVTAEKFGLHLSMGRANAQVTLLLHLLPNLEDLEITPGIELDTFDNFLDNLTSLNGRDSIPPETLPVGLRRLRFARRCSQSTMGGFRASKLLPLMMLPRIGFVSAHICSGGLIDEETAATLYGKSNAVSLDFTFSNIAANTLSHLLRIPRELRSLRYEHAGPIIRREQWNPQEFRRALQYVRHSLSSLHLRVKHLSRSDDRQPGIGSLQDWPKLTYLRCAIETLLGTRESATSRLMDMLPPVIEELWIESANWGDVDTVEQLEEVLGRKKTGDFSALKKICLGQALEDSLFGRLKAACDAAGVLLM